MAANLAPDAPLVAETGGLNAMIVDSTALPEQVVKDVIDSAFQSAGQRCSALRVLYLQEDIADDLLTMLFGAMDELQVGDPWLTTTDIGPVIDDNAKAKIWMHCDRHKRAGRVLKQLAVPAQGRFVAPTVIRVDGIQDLEEEVFGPVLHVATFAADEIETVVDQINASGYGLTFGLHTRVNARVDQLTDRINAGNIYVNRNQIGAIVGSQPFGGEGLSGTGPKAGGPHYVRRFMTYDSLRVGAEGTGNKISAGELAKAVKAVNQTTAVDLETRQAVLKKLCNNSPAALDAEPSEMPGPTGELNLLSCVPRGTIICAGPDAESARTQALVALSQGNKVVAIAPGIEAELQQQTTLPLLAIDGFLDSAGLATVDGFDAIASSAASNVLSAYRNELAERDGPLMPLITETLSPERYILERHLCVDTTAAGGNASLVASSE